MFLYLVISTLLLRIEHQYARMIFQTVGEHVTINGLQHFLKQNVHEKLKCYMLCQRNPDRCCLVQAEKQMKNWACTLYDYVGNVEIYLKDSPGTLVLTPQANQMDCLDWLRQGYTKDGVYYINLQGLKKKVFCDMTTNGGGWVVIQKRFDGSVDFNRNWKSYKEGFGGVYGEHWLVNEFVHQYTKVYETEMYAQAKSFDDDIGLVKMKKFTVSNENTKYILDYSQCEVLHGNGNLCKDWNSKHKGKPFTTSDMDNDEHKINCAKSYKGGWWYTGCHAVYFTGPYINGSYINNGAFGIIWHKFRGHNESLREATIAIRRIN